MLLRPWGVGSSVFWVVWSLGVFGRFGEPMGHCGWSVLGLCVLGCGGGPAALALAAYFLVRGSVCAESLQHNIIHVIPQRTCLLRHMLCQSWVTADTILQPKLFLFAVVLSRFHTTVKSFLQNSNLFLALHLFVLWSTTWKL